MAHWVWSFVFLDGLGPSSKILHHRGIRKTLQIIGAMQSASFELIWEAFLLSSEMHKQGPERGYHTSEPSKDFLS